MVSEKEVTMTNYTIGWIKLHRQLLEWEWYSDVNVRLVFIHCLLKANFEDKKWRGQEIKRGSFVSSYGNLAKEIGISVKQLRTSISKLEKTSEMAIKSNTKNTVFTIVSYCEYQSEDKPKVTPKADERHTEGKPRATTKEVNNKRSKEVNKIGSLDSDLNQLLQNWIEYRKEIKKPIKSQKTIDSLIETIKSRGFQDSKNVIDNSIQNGYQGLFWDKKPKEVSGYKSIRAQLKF